MNFLLRFLALALSRPMVTLRLAHPRRIKNALITIIFRPQDLAHLYQRYKDIYFPSGQGSPASISCSRGPLGDIVIFPVVDWNFRFQRPQHLALQLAKQGFRVFYLSATPYLADRLRRYCVQETPEERLFVIQLSAGTSRTFDLHSDKLNIPEIQSFVMALDALRQDFDIRSHTVIVHHPFWFPVVQAFGGNKIGYDCFDHHAGFVSDAAHCMCDYESDLIQTSDFVTTSSSALYQRVSTLRSCHLMRNGCDFQTFSRLSAPAPRARRVAGYIGAIASWFDIDLLVSVARQLPGWDFVLVGAAQGCDVSVASKVANIKFVGEVPYSQVPSYLESFDVCLIPFRITALTQATNPVKVYEYLASGRPVVSTPLAELEELDIAGVFLAGDEDRFAGHVVTALEAAQSQSSVAGWKAWASKQSWEERALQFAKIMSECGSRGKIDTLNALSGG